LVKPNVDTLYSRVFLDLSSSDLAVTIPDMTDRYWTWPFYDAYANDVANLSPLQSYPGGTYLVRYEPNNPGAWLAANSTNSSSSSYAGYVNLPTPYGISLVRILVQPENGGTAAVNALQDQLHVTEIPRDAQPVAPALNLSIFYDAAIVPGGQSILEQGVLNLGALLAQFNPSEVVADRSWINETLRDAGFSFPNGTSAQPAGTNLTAASASANASVAAEAKNTGFEIQIGTSWTMQNTSFIGNYYDAYFARYSVATAGYLAMTDDQVLYPVYGGALTASNTTVLLVIFDSRPPLEDLGFWSLTAYNAAGYLIENPIDVYALGDRSNLTMMDGSKYSDGTDGPFQILVQPGNVVPPANWTSNWLPSPAESASFQLGLRFYGPSDALRNDSWTYPSAETVAAITA
ncbi:hypothetical protein M406DRAFT_259012, partial [Cryphonectria parasitica EP155]